MKLYHDDCFNILKRMVKAKKKVDMILCDLPYGTTANKWDIVIDIDALFYYYKKVTHDNTPIVLFSDEPFTHQLICQNRELFRYKWIWNKLRGSNFQNARYMPMKCHEEILVFYKKLPVYNPQWWYSKPYIVSSGRRANQIEGLSGSGSITMTRSRTESVDGRRYPLSIIEFKRDANRVHPTQKPVALLEYLIKTYTLKNQIVLDNCMGSGSTGVACVNTNRSFIGVEKEEKYFDIAKERIIEVYYEKRKEAKKTK